MSLEDLVQRAGWIVRRLERYDDLWFQHYWMNSAVVVVTCCTLQLQTMKSIGSHHSGADAFGVPQMTPLCFLFLFSGRRPKKFARLKMLSDVTRHTFSCLHTRTDSFPVTPGRRSLGFSDRRHDLWFAHRSTSVVLRPSFLLMLWFSLIYAVFLCDDDLLLLQWSMNFSSELCWQTWSNHDHFRFLTLDNVLPLQNKFGFWGEYMVKIRINQ